jgi:hypothetical protein
MGRSRKPLTCATCNQPLYRSWDENGVEEKSHMFFGDDEAKQQRDSLLDYHHRPMTKEDLKAAQKKVSKLSPNHPVLSMKQQQSVDSGELPDNVISLDDFRNRKNRQ